ncbi:hypothetical protein [uncultured Bacteroides sp.]|uniref:hypothetical protein n=1 Tax=uncultured Bacteroides sp. TaxID=162156 RepID=UPI00266F581D|nr:hypothetical protein [uncultured Bacteroides sp.]
MDWQLGHDGLSEIFCSLIVCFVFVYFGPFVEAEGYRLTSNDITALLWPKGNGTASKVYQSITRLRISLQRVSNMTLVNEGSVYRLKVAHFIEEN